MRCNQPPRAGRLTTALSAVTLGMLGALALPAQADIAATHIYHNHMPNFWPYFDVSKYDSLAVGAPIRYMYDGQVKQLKASPPSGYTFYIPGSTTPMPHDDLESYYAHHAKKGAYLSWPMDTAAANSRAHPLSQTHVTMSAAVINNVQSFAELGNQGGYNLGWGDYWRTTQQTFKTTNGYKALDTIHFAGHHSMGPLVGNDYLLKDLIYQNVTLAQPYFLGSSFTSSKGFFPTELGFSDRIIPVLNKLGITWSVIGNVHFSRTLQDYPYLNDPGVDTLVSPPNRADLRNVSNVGSWVSAAMFNEKQVTHNKFPFASIPHWVQYVDPNTAAVSRVAGIPVEQASSWEEGYQGSVTAALIKPFDAAAAALGRKQYFVVAHDGDNSSGRAGDGGTWLNSGQVTYSDAGVTGMGVEEYLKANPIPDSDVVHVQDGSWIDTRDSSADPTWYHWHLPMGVWNGQLAAFNTAHGTSYTQLYAANGDQRSHMPSLEYGYHYLERNFALLQAALNYAKTAEQIWLDDHPNYWKPSTAMDGQVTYSGNQLNPWMLSFPVKGDASKDYAGGANPAELGWYFLLASIDSGFGYYDENVDDGVKPTISFNQSLNFTEPYVTSNLGKDRTGPSIWWPQRYPYNPGSANASKAEGWAKMYMDNEFAIYTYAYDVSGISDIKVKVRVHTDKRASATDKTYRLYDPAAHADDPLVDPSKVGAWVSYSMKERDLTPDINGVSWQPSSTATFKVVPAKKIGNLFYTYLSDYRDQLLDYYIEATDNKGNITRSEIQQVYVGAGRYKMVDGKKVEDINGDIAGEHAFFTDKAPQKKVTVYVQGSVTGLSGLSVDSKDDGQTSWTNQTVAPFAGTDRWFRFSDTYSGDVSGSYIRYQENGIPGYKPSADGRLFSEGTWTLLADGSVSSGKPADLKLSATIYYHNTAWSKACLHYRIDTGTWTTSPGVTMNSVGNSWYAYTVDMGTGEQVEFVTNNCSGTWDNNGGSNYKTGPGTWSLSSGVIVEGAPSTDVNQPPVAVITPGSQTVAAGTTLTLSAAGSSDPDGSIASYKWSTGETTSSISVTVNATQTYTVTVTDNKGATSTASVTLTVPANQAPVAVITPGSQSVKPGTVVTLSGASSTDADGSIVSYKWSTGETTSSISVTVNQTKTITLTVTDNQGATGTASVTLTADSGFSHNFAQLYFRGTPNSWGTLAMDLVANNTWQTTVTFTGAGDNTGSQRFKFDVNGDWTKNYGDTNKDGILEVGGGDIPSTAVGTCTVQVNDSTLAWKVSCPSAPVVSISPASTTVTTGSTVTFTATATDSDGTIQSYLWDSGEATASISRTFTAAGSYTVSVTVTDNSGLQTTAKSTVTVQDQVSYKHNLSQLYFRGTSNSWGKTAMTLIADNTWQTDVTFTGVGDSTGSQRFKFDVTGDWSKNYGDTNKDGILDLTGSDIVTAVIATCKVRVNDATMAYSVLCPAAPVVTVTPLNPLVKTGSAVTFTATATDSDGTIKSLLWDTGETTSTLTRTFNTSGTYKVSVTATDDSGLSTTASTTVTVSDNPAWAANLTQLYFRGTPNTWGKTAMTLVADHTWQATVAFTGAGDANGSQRFKFDVNGDWVKNYGDNNADGVAELAGKDIATSVVGSYVVTFNDSTLKYSVTAP